jgi:ATP-binding cassette, subfamily C, bacterial CydCD
VVGTSDLTTLDLAAWRKRVSWVPQRPTMFRGSVRDNIAIADPAASPDSIQRAAHSAAADRFAADLPRGLDTMIGDGARRLSAGEITRLAVARAMVRSSDLLILDEPTSGLDDRTAMHVLSAIRRDAADRAVLLIEHREGRTVVADRVVRIADGRAAELIGTTA